MSLEDDLRRETEKWFGKIKEEIEKIDENGCNEEFLTNIKAYVNDSEHFLSKNDLIRAFEAVIWAWAWLEIGREKGFLK